MSTIGASSVSTSESSSVSTIGASSVSTLGASSVSTLGASSVSTIGASSVSTSESSSVSTIGASSVSTLGASSVSTLGPSSVPPLGLSTVLSTSTVSGLFVVVFGVASLLSVSSGASGFERKKTVVAATATSAPAANASLRIVQEQEDKLQDEGSLSSICGAEVLSSAISEVVSSGTTMGAGAGAG